MTQPFRFSDGKLAYNIKDLVRLCEQYPTEGIYYLMRGDFEKWLEYIGETDLLQSAKEARQTSLYNDEERLKRFLTNCQSPTSKDLKPNQESNLQDKKLELEIQKLSLEIENLRKKQLEKIIQFITAAVAVVGLLFGIVRFQSEQNLSRKLRIQNQIRSDLDELIQYTKDESQNLSRALFLLDNIKTSIKYSDYQKENITSIFINMINADCDFDKLRDVNFDIIVFQNWVDYPRYLRENLKTQDFIIYKYFQAFRHLHDRDPSYFETIRYESDLGKYQVNQYTDEHLFLHFAALVKGFSLHLEHLENPDFQKKAVERFQDATKNPTLTQQLYGNILGKLDNKAVVK